MQKSILLTDQDAALIAEAIASWVYQAQQQYGADHVELVAIADWLQEASMKGSVEMFAGGVEQ